MADSPNILVFPLKVAADGSIRGRCTAKNSRSRSSSAQVRDGMMGAGIGFSSSSSHSQFCPALPSRRKQQFADRRSLQASRCQPGCKARPTGVRQIHRAFALDERLECSGGLRQARHQQRRSAYCGGVQRDHGSHSRNSCTTVSKTRARSDDSPTGSNSEEAGTRLGAPCASAAHSREGREL